MLKVNATAGTYTANSIIPLTAVFNTNNSTILNNNQIVVRKPGFLEIIGKLELIGTVVGDTQVALIDENGNTLSTSTATFTAIGDYATIPIYDMLRIIYNSIGSFEKLSLQVNAAVTINSGVITAKYIR